MNNTASTQEIRPKCPRCGWVRRIEIPSDGARMEEGALGLKDALEQAVERFKNLWNDTSIDDANAWIDLPPCPKCKTSYQYNVRTGKTR